MALSASHIAAWPRSLLPVMSRLAALVLLLTSVAVSAKADRGGTALADAVEKQDHRRIQALLKQGADVNAAQVDGMTALHWAVHHDDLAMARRLVAARANVNAANRYGVSALSLACSNGSAELVEIL